MAEIQTQLEGMSRVRNMQIGPDHHHYIVLSQLFAWLTQEALPLARGILLDYGCGGQPYRQLFEGRVEKYIGADVAAAAGIILDIEFLPNHQLPLPDASVDTILANQTLEHVPDPSFYLGECRRLLRRGGTLILTAPMQWRHHEVPFDYLRFTRYGLTELLRKAGFGEISITPSGGVYSLLGQIWLNHLSERGAGRRLVNRCVNHLALWLDRKNPDLDDTINWMCIARRPD